MPDNTVIPKTLSTSERVHLISEIAARLGESNWTLVDITLRQFGLPWRSGWTGELVDYVMEMIENAPESSLIELGRHLGYEPSVSRSVVAPAFWRSGYFRLFVSHIAKHRRFIGQMQDRLMIYGISCFVAHTDVEPTLEWQEAILSALATCDAMVASLHPGFFDSQWTDQEIGYALGRGQLVVSLSFGIDPKGFLGRFQAVSASTLSVEELSRDLYQILRNHPDTRKRISEAVVQQFEESESFQSAKTNMYALEQLEYWDGALARRAEKALANNDQISEAWGLPERLQKLNRPYK